MPSSRPPAAAQAALFDPEPSGPAADAGDDGVEPAAQPPEVQALARRLAERHATRLRLGTSSWHFPGWAGLVWSRPEPAARLSRHGLGALARHPLMGCVSLDRSFYRPLPQAEYALLRAQAGGRLRLIVKAWSAITDATNRDAGGAAVAPNPLFLDPQAALQACLLPAATGLGDALGALLIQLSPLPRPWLREPDRLFDALGRLWHTLRPALPEGARLALELRDGELLTPALAAHLRAHGVQFCLGLHDRMPAADAQLPLLRALWPDDLLVRWNLVRGSRYGQARDRFEPFDRLQQPDLPTRAELARLAAAVLAAGRSVTVAINNKAEGSAPLSVLELARAIDAQGVRPPGGGAP